jgi:acyl-homoserine lactone acylase PvdQ
MESIFKYLEDWDGRFNLDSIGATCYTYTHYYFVKSLLHRFYPDDEASRMKIVEQISFIDYLQRMFLDLERDADTSPFNIACQSANEYKGPDYCAHNLAEAFVQAYEYLDGILS